MDITNTNITAATALGIVDIRLALSGNLMTMNRSAVTATVSHPVHVRNVLVRTYLQK